MFPLHTKFQQLIAIMLYHHRLKTVLQYSNSYFVVFKFIFVLWLEHSKFQYAIKITFLSVHCFVQIGVGLVSQCKKLTLSKPFVTRFFVHLTVLTCFLSISMWFVSSMLVFSSRFKSIVKSQILGVVCLVIHLIFDSGLQLPTVLFVLRLQSAQDRLCVWNIQTWRKLVGKL